jgi:putative component of membrane protein insertase Oxa1/YidC/SpoIIIJ protein YidD
MKLVVLVFLILVSINTKSYCQEIDWNQLNNKMFQTTFIKSQFELKKKVRFTKFKSKNYFIRYNPITLSFGGLLFLYQSTFSQQFSANCPFELSCSNFSKMSIQQFGLFKGVLLSADRLTKCNQFLKYDIAPIQLNEINKIIDSPSTYRLNR